MQKLKQLNEEQDALMRESKLRNQKENREAWRAQEEIRVRKKHLGEQYA